MKGFSAEKPFFPHEEKKFGGEAIFAVAVTEKKQFQETMSEQKKKSFPFSFLTV